MSGYYPIISEDKRWETYDVHYGDEIYRKAGILQWNGHWGCYVFIPDDIDLQFGPAFLASLTAEMIRLEAIRRKEWMNDSKPVNAVGMCPSKHTQEGE